MDEELLDASKPLPGFTDKTWARFCNVKKQLKEQKSKERLEYRNRKAKNKRIANDEDSHQGGTSKSIDCKGVNTSTENKKDSCGKDASFDWLNVSPYLNINSHLVQTTGTNTKPKSGLELRIDDALRNGDLNEASKLNDHLINREFANQIVDACEAKRYVEKKKAEKEYKKLNKKTNLAWGFEQKRRWETKGNM